MSANLLKNAVFKFKDQITHYQNNGMRWIKLVISEWNSLPKKMKIAMIGTFFFGGLVKVALDDLPRWIHLAEMKWKIYQEQTDSIPVMTTFSERMDMQEKFKTYAVLQPQSEAILRPPSQVIVSEVLVPIGQKVKKGQPLVRFKSDANALKAQLEQIDLERKQMDIEITLALSKKDYVSGREAKQSKLDLRSNEIRRSLNQIESQTMIISPIDGILAENNMLVGSFIDQAQNYQIRVIEPQGYRAELYIPEETANKINGDSKVSLIPENGTGTIEGKIAGIGQTLDPRTGSVFLGAVFPSTEHTVRVGSVVNLEVVMNELTDIVVVPSEAIVNKNGKTYVYVVSSKETEQPDSGQVRAPASDTEEDDKLYAKLKEVKTGIEQEGKVHITEGIDSEEQVVIRGQNRLTDGAQVEPST